MRFLLLVVPGRPTDLIGNARNGTSVLLSWNKPNDPNGVILGYQVFYYGYMGNHTKVNTVNKCCLSGAWIHSTFVKGYKSMHTHPSINIHTHTQMHTYIYIHMHTYIYTHI